MRFMFLTSANRLVMSLLVANYSYTPNQKPRFIFLYHILPFLAFFGTLAQLMSYALIPTDSDLVT